MGIFGTKEKNYDNEIMELNNKTSELSKATDKNKSDIILFGNDVTELKEEMKYFLEQYKVMSREHSEMKKLLEDFKNDQKLEIEITKQKSGILTCGDICKKIALKNLNQTSLKYFLYELGLLKLNINKHLNTYAVVSDYEKVNSEVGQYMHVSGRVITFDKEVLNYFNEHTNQLKESIERYLRKQTQFKESKKHLSKIQVNNYQKEINKICGVSDSYDKEKWAKIYGIYKKYHPNFWNEHNKYVEKFLKENPNEKKPTMITYLVQEVGDGDVLLKIACELFVD